MNNAQHNHKKSLHEKDGIEQPDFINQNSIRTIQKFRKKPLNVETLIEKLRQGAIPSLSKAITLVESTQPNHQEQAHQIIQECLPFANQSIRIGITGVPGVGKSTFIEAFGMHLTSIGKKVAVLAIDPSSTISRGSILGDKTRMEDLVKDENAFIRPSASGETLGGVARKTRESIILCEACGFDVVIIETVGVGQSETAVHSMVDFFLLLKLSGAGDELQGIKRGIMEMADGIVINKADGDNIKKAKIAKRHYSNALHLFPLPESGWTPEVLTYSGYYGYVVAEVWDMVHRYIDFVKKNGYFDRKRQEQSKYRMFETINEHLRDSFYKDPEIEEMLIRLEEELLQAKKTSYVAAREALDKYFSRDPLRPTP